MRSRFLIPMGGLLVAIALGFLMPAHADGQSPKPAAPAARTPASAPFTPPRTPWGDPDLQGQWNGQTSTPLQRPVSGPLAGKDTISEDEAETLEETNRASIDRPPTPGDPGTYNAFWRDPGTPLTRTSLIVDPPDGRIPALTPEAQKREAAIAADRKTRGPADTYEDISVWTRCISRGWNGIGSYYSSNYQIVQAPGYVVVLQELIHEARIIPLDGRPHVPGSISQWMGDSRGHWEGNTLVVDTTNFDRRTNFQGSRDTLHLIERYTLVSPKTIDYRFTIDDPKTFVSAWTVARPLARVAGGPSVFEYACHEGNYAMPGILGGARVEEKAAAEGAAKGGSK
jgi:hypothetical protein